MILNNFDEPLPKLLQSAIHFYNFRFSSVELQKSSFGLSVDQLVLKSYKIRMYESGMAILQEHS